MVLVIVVVVNVVVGDVVGTKVDVVTSSTRDMNQAISGRTSRKI